MQLREDLHHCLVGGRSIFLDLERDRYFALAKPLDDAFQHILSDPAGVSADEGAVSQLREAGILVATGALSTRLLTDTWKQPRISLYDAILPGSSSWWPVLETTAHHLIVIAMLRCKPIKSLLQERAARKRRLLQPARGPEVLLGTIISRLWASEKIMSPHGRCLSNSIMVFDELLRCGYTAELYFGVSNTPFSAHCWVQIDDMLINDTLENVALYTPLLRI